MKVTITSKTLTIVPYLSTPWDNIDSIYAENRQEKLYMIVLLKNGSKVEVPNLSEKAIEQVLNHHTKHLEEETPTEARMELGFPMQMGEEGMDMISSAMQHDPSQSDAPDLPKEIFDKISKISSILDSDEDQLPQPVEGCNCVHCQIAKALLNDDSNSEIAIDEIVSDEELSFRTWDIKQKEEHLYIVTNPLDSNEQYQVFLGNPIGCTCGKNDCEHIQAVLKS